MNGSKGERSFFKKVLEGLTPIPHTSTEEVPMADEDSSRAVEPAPVIPCVAEKRSKTVFAEWLDRERVTPEVFAAELGITANYVRNLKAGRGSPGAKLRLKIAMHTKGAVRFDDWE